VVVEVVDLKTTVDQERLLQQQLVVVELEVVQVVLQRLEELISVVVEVVVVDKVLTLNVDKLEDQVLLLLEDQVQLHLQQDLVQIQHQQLQVDVKLLHLQFLEH
jgi:hypothetical protein